MLLFQIEEFSEQLQEHFDDVQDTFCSDLDDPDDGLCAIGGEEDKKKLVDGQDEMATAVKSFLDQTKVGEIWLVVFCVLMLLWCNHLSFDLLGRTFSVYHISYTSSVCSIYVHCMCIPVYFCILCTFLVYSYIFEVYSMYLPAYFCVFLCDLVYSMM